jgi:hypothetical protein
MRCARPLIAADNVLATLREQAHARVPFNTIGQLATIGRRAGVRADLRRALLGLLAWWLWRTIYLAKLPRAEKKAARDARLDPRPVLLEGPRSVHDRAISRRCRGPPIARCERAGGCPRKEHLMVTLIDLRRILHAVCARLAFAPPLLARLVIGVVFVHSGFRQVDAPRPGGEVLHRPRHPVPAAPGAVRGERRARRRRARAGRPRDAARGGCR